MKIQSEIDGYQIQSGVVQLPLGDYLDLKQKIATLEEDNKDILSRLEMYKRRYYEAYN